jgi:hypothetical protein
VFVLLCCPLALGCTGVVKGEGKGRNLGEGIAEEDDGVGDIDSLS